MVLGQGVKSDFGFDIPSIRVRFLCRFLDTSLMPILCVLFAVFFGCIIALVFFGEPGYESFMHSVERTPLYIYFASNVIMFSVIDFVSGVSLFKWLFGIRVIGQDRCSLSFKNALIRNLYIFVDGFLFGLVGYVAMEKDEFSRRNGDVAAKAIVVKYRNSGVDSIKTSKIIFGIALSVIVYAVFMSGGSLLHDIYVR